MNKKKSHRLIRIKDVTAMTNLSKSYIYQLSKEGLFPKPVKIVPRGVSVGWIFEEVNDWIDSRIKDRDEAA